MQIFKHVLWSSYVLNDSFVCFAVAQQLLKEDNAFSFSFSRANNYKIGFFRILCQFICSQPLIDFLVDNKSILSSTYGITQRLVIR